jgi:hypothetical protein
MITDEKTKEMLTEILVEMMQNKRELFYEIVLEALEDIGLANAIAEGLNGEFVPGRRRFCYSQRRNRVKLQFASQFSKDLSRIADL